MKVRATRVGYYVFGDDPKNHTRRYPAEYSHKPGAGEPFELLKPEHFSPNWMEIVEATPEELEIVKDKRKFDSLSVPAFAEPVAAPGVKIRSDDEEFKRRMNPRKKKDSEVSDEKEVI